MRASVPVAGLPAYPVGCWCRTPCLPFPLSPCLARLTPPGTNSAGIIALVSYFPSRNSVGSVSRSDRIPRTRRMSFLSSSGRRSSCSRG